jgi:hypothetical protein
MHDPPLAQSEEKHIRDAWIWAATIIAVAAILTLSGLFAQVTNQGARDADAAGAGGRDTVRLVQER